MGRSRSKPQTRNFPRIRGGGSSCNETLGAVSVRHYGGGWGVRSKCRCCHSPVHRPEERTGSTWGSGDPQPNVNIHVVQCLSSTQDPPCWPFREKLPQDKVTHLPSQLTAMTTGGECHRGHAGGYCPLPLNPINSGPKVCFRAEFHDSTILHT